MVPGFSFERALTFGFKAPHVKSFPWLIGLANGIAGAAIMLGVLWAAKAQTTNVVNKIMAFIQSGVEPEREEIFELLKELWTGIWPILAGAALIYWVIASVLTTATMRRYIRDEKFSLGFGADEMRVMTVYLGWSAMGLIAMAPFLLIMGGLFWSGLSAAINGGEEPSETAVFGAVGGAVGLMIILFPIYVFFATRLAPCFALTVKDRQVRFFDGWNVSRGRFWPIFGAYAILAIAGSVLSSVINQLVQGGVTIGFPFDNLMDIDTPQDALDAVFSPVVMTTIAIMVFMQSATEGICKHFLAAPAALAARHDPRNDMGMEQSIDVFS